MIGTRIRNNKLQNECENQLIIRVYISILSAEQQLNCKTEGKK